jgi:hypothetical protein
MTVAHADTDREYWSHGYWIGHCQGFRVVDENGKVGFVEEVVGENDEPEALLVRSGLFSDRILRVPIRSVEGIQPETASVRLRHAAR